MTSPHKERAKQVISADEPVTDSYVQTVPDKCDRIVWRGRYIHLSVGQETTPQPSEDEISSRTELCSSQKKPGG